MKTADDDATLALRSIENSISARIADPVSPTSPAINPPSTDKNAYLIVLVKVHSISMSLL